LLTKAHRHRQCKTLWDYPSFRTFYKRPPCRRCGKTGYAPDDCIVPEQCVNCIGPDRANFHKCSARPRKVHGVFRRLAKEPREHARTVSVETCRQRNLETQPELQPRAAELQRDNTANGIEHRFVWTMVVKSPVNNTEIDSNGSILEGRKGRKGVGHCSHGLGCLPCDAWESAGRKKQQGLMTSEPLGW
jgi:hypothetical protein